MSLLPLHSPSVASIVFQLLFWCTYIIIFDCDFFISAFHHSLSPSIPYLHLHSYGSNNILSRLNDNMVSINDNNNQHIKEAAIEDGTTRNIKTDDQLVDNNEHQQNNNNNNNNNNETTTNKRRERKRSKKEAARQRRLDRIKKNGGPPETTFVGKHKWLGGAVDPSTGKIYGIPSHSHQIICITPSSSSEDNNNTPPAAASISTIPLPNEYHEGHFKWLRGIIYNHNLYGIPAWSTKGVLKLDLQTHTVSILPLPNSPTYYQSNYKPIPTKKEQRSTAGNPMSIDRGRWMWHGGAIGYNSNNEAAIYCPPSNAEFVLKVYLDGSDRVEEIGMPLSDGQNKWYGKFLLF